MDIKIMGEDGKEKIESQVTPSNGEKSVEPYETGELLLPQIGEIFNLTPNEVNESKGKINTILDYAKTQTEDRSVEGLKWAIRSLQDKVGTPPLGQKWLPFLAEYAFIALETGKWEEKKRSFEK